VGEHTIKLDQEQIKSMLQILQTKEGRPKLINWNLTLSALQCLSIVVFGLWTIYLYEEFQKRYNELQIEKIGIDTANSSIALQRSRGILYNLEWELKSEMIKDLGNEAIFYVLLQTELKNISDVSFSIPYRVFEIFSSDSLEHELSTKASFIVPPVPNVWSKALSMERENEFWEPLRTIYYEHEYLVEDTVIRMIQDRSNLEQRTGGGGTVDDLGPDSSASGAIGFFVRRKKESLLAVSMTWGMANESLDQYRWMDQWVTLSSDKQANEESDPVIE
jgi:hypothetical protein